MTQEQAKDEVIKQCKESFTSLQIAIVVGHIVLRILRNNKQL